MAAPTLITSALYPTIRALIDLTLTATTLPDTTIELPVFVHTAEAEVLRQDPDAAGRTGSEQTHIQNAVCLFTAAYLSPTLPPIQSANMDAAGYGSRQTNQQERTANLLGKAQTEMDYVLSPADTTPSQATVFAVGEGRRGQ